MSSYIQKHLTKGERVLYQAKPSLWAYFPWLLIGGVLLLAIGPGSILGICILASVWLRYTSTELAFTNQRLIAKTGVISRHTIEMRLSKVESVQVTQSIFGRMLGYGTLVVSGAGNPQAPIANISSPMAFRQALLEHQDGLPAGLPAIEAQQTGPADKDSWEGTMYEEPAVRRVAMAVMLTYTDANGQQTRRQVDITAYSPSPTGMVLGHCHLRGANRTFKFSRIQQAIDAETGEIIPSLLHALEARWVASPEATMDTLLAEHADTLKLLLFTAKADGAMRAAEVAVITRMCKSITGDERITPVMVKTLFSYMGTPTINSFVRLYNAMRREDPARAKHVADACRQIIATQKDIHPSEQAVLDALNKPLKA